MKNTPMTKQHPMLRERVDAGHVLDNQQGSVIVLVLMVLTIMTVLGIVSSDSVVTENFIVRNVGIHQQNVSILDSALMVGLQEFMQISDADAGNFAANGGPNSAWFNNMHNTTPAAGDPEEFINTIWYENVFTRRCLDAANSQRRQYPAPAGHPGRECQRQPELCGRGIRAGGSGLDGGESLVVGAGANWRQGRILSEYVSADAGGNDNGNGMLRMEIGVKRMW